jgi:hypothetical protein
MKLAGALAGGKCLAAVFTELRKDLLVFNMVLAC